MLKGIKNSITIFTFCLLLAATGANGEEKYTSNECFEKVSRGTLKFNMALDKAIFKPIAKGYRSLPVPIRLGTSNAVSNLRSLLSLSNNILQGDLKLAGNTAGRFIINSTVGILGFNDVATRMGIAKTDEDSGQTLGTYGVASGPYVVLPLLGPSSVRDGLGRIVDLFADPLNNIARDRETKIAANTLKVIDTRARLLSAEQAFEALAFDRYMAMRSAYFAIRESQIED